MERNALHSAPPPPPPPPRRSLPSQTTPGIHRTTAPRNAASAALAALLFLPLTPAAAVTCTVQPGTLNEADGSFTAGTEATGNNDFLFTCTPDGPGEIVDFRDDTDDEVIDEAVSEYHRRLGVTRSVNELDELADDVIVEIRTPGASLVSDGVGDKEGRLIVLKGVIRGADGRPGADPSTDGLDFDLNIDSYAEVRTTGGARGIQIGINDEDSDKGVRLRNFGSVSTSGEGTPDEPRRGYAVFVYSVADGADVEVSNEAGATITTSGKAGRGLFATIDRGGTAAAVNRGAVTTTGDTFIDVTGSTRSSDGVYAYGGHGAARAVNEAGATIRTEGTGARGLVATNEGTRGGAVAENRGAVTTTGGPRPNAGRQGSYGIHAWSESNSAEAVNHENARVTTEGAGARGIGAGTVGGGADEFARAVNHGTVTTTGGGVHSDTSVRTASGMRALSGFSGDPDARASAVAEAVNHGLVETGGEGARGVIAHTDGSGGAQATNRGRITTRGNAYRVDRQGDDNDTWYGAHGLAAFTVTTCPEAGCADVDDSSRPLRASAPATVINEVVVTNDEGEVTGGVIETHGTTAIGMLARSRGDGAARAVNKGRVTTHQIEAVDDLPGSRGVAYGAAHGVFAYSRGGAAVVVNEGTGRVETKGAEASGLFARTDSGTATVTMSGGGVRAERGVGIRAEAGAEGAVAVTVSSTAEAAGAGTLTTVTAPVAVRVTGGRGKDHVTVTVDTSLLDGRVDMSGAAAGGRLKVSRGVIDGGVLFGAGDDELVMERRGIITGNVDFGAGTDVLVLDVEGTGAETSVFEGVVTGLEEMFKRGTGTARLGDVTFTGSRLAIEEGGLALTGHLDLGTEGTVEIRDDTRLTFVVGEDFGTEGGEDDHGRITAGGGITFTEEGQQAFFLSLTSALGGDEEKARRVQNAVFDALADNRLALLRGPTQVTGAQGGTVALQSAGAGGAAPVAVGTLALGADGRPGGTTVDEAARAAARDGTLVVGQEPSAPASPIVVVVSESPASDGSSGGGSSGGGKGVAIVAGGLSAVAALFEIFDLDLFGGGEELPDDPEAGESGESEDASSLVSFAGPRLRHAVEHHVRKGGVEYWSRSFAGGAAPVAAGAEGTVRGFALGLDAALGGGFSLGVSAMPGVSVSSREGSDSSGETTLSGGRYALVGGWSDGARFARASLSHGEYRGQSVFDEPVTGGALGGAFGVSQTHALVGAGVRLDLGGVRATPSVSWFSGDARQGAYTAQNAVVRTAVPALSQRYEGWKAGLSLAPKRWRSGPKGMRWLPGVRLSARRTHGEGPGGVMLRHSDKAGVLGFASGARAAALPRMMVGVGAAVNATGSKPDRWKLRMGYAGMVVDGEPDHAVLARLHVRF